MPRDRAPHTSTAPSSAAPTPLRAPALHVVGHSVEPDVLYTGGVDAGRRAQLVRLAFEARARDAHDVLTHLITVMDAVGRLAQPRSLLPLPAAPLRELEVTLQPGSLALSARSLATTAACLEWPLEWLRTRGLILSQGLKISVEPA
jgi:hypothetical protein